MSARYAAGALRSFAAQLLEKTGLAAERAAVVADVLVEADLLGHDTHGLDMLARYLDQLADGRMAREGEPETLNDRGSALTWDGRVYKAVRSAIESASTTELRAVAK